MNNPIFLHSRINREQLRAVGMAASALRFSAHNDEQTKASAEELLRIAAELTELETAICLHNKCLSEVTG